MIPNVYYGWRVVAATMAIYTLVMGVTFSSFGLYVIPVARDFGLSRADANSALILLNVGSAVLSPPLGWVLDRVSAPTIMVASGLCLIIGCVTLAWLPVLWLCAIVLTVPMAFAFKGAGTLTAPALIARWFTRRLGRAMTISQLGYAIAGVVTPPIVGLLIDTQGWRSALTISGVVAGTAVIAIALLIRERPGQGELEESAAAAVDPSQARATDGRPLTVKDVLTSPPFWTINLSCCLVAANATTVSVSLAPFAQGQGLTMLQSASLISTMAATGIAAQMLIAAIVDRFDRVFLLCGMFLVGALFQLGLLLGAGYGQLLLVIAGLGVVSSAVPALRMALNVDYFGARSFGTVLGLSLPISALLGVVSMRLAGEIFDRTVVMTHCG